jgi:hypothetical protein
MLDAFASGGDFHSRTAMGMYPEIQQSIDSGEVNSTAVYLLECGVLFSSWCAL